MTASLTPQLCSIMASARICRGSPYRDQLKAVYCTRTHCPCQARAAAHACSSCSSGLPCLWYRYRIERRNGDKWERVESGVSHDPFGISDGSGQILVDPDGAEILTSHKQVSNVDNYRKSEWTLIEGEVIYVIGEHVTLSGPNAVLDKKADLSTLLAEWKADKAALLARFDADRNGEISLEEWERARQAASVEVDRAHLDIRLKDGIHLLRKPAHGRPFLMANREVTALVRHYRLWSWLHLAFMLGALTGLVMTGHSA